MSTDTKTGQWAPGAVLFLLIISSAGAAVAQCEYVPITVEDGGTITGTVKWTGQIPKIPKLPITKNADVCDPDSHKIRDLERSLIDSDGGVANTVVYLKEISKGKANGSSRITSTHGPKELPIHPAHYAGATRRRSANQEQ